MRLFEPPIERRRMAQLREPPSPALLARGHQHTPPVLLAFLQTRPVQADHAALAEQGADAGDAELHGLLNDQIHAFPPGHPDPQMDRQYRRWLPVGRVADLHAVAEQMGRSYEATKKLHARALELYRRHLAEG